MPKKDNVPTIIIFDSFVAPNDIDVLQKNYPQITFEVDSSNIVRNLSRPEEEKNRIIDGFNPNYGGGIQTHAGAVARNFLRTHKKVSKQMALKVVFVPTPNYEVKNVKTKTLDEAINRNPVLKKFDNLLKTYRPIMVVSSTYINVERDTPYNLAAKGVASEVYYPQILKKYGAFLVNTIANRQSGTHSKDNIFGKNLFNVKGNEGNVVRVNNNTAGLLVKGKSRYSNEKAEGVIEVQTNPNDIRGNSFSTPRAAAEIFSMVRNEVKNGASLGPGGRLSLQVGLEIAFDEFQNTDKYPRLKYEFNTKIDSARVRIRKRIQTSMKKFQEDEYRNAFTESSGNTTELVDTLLNTTSNEKKALQK